MQIDGQIDDQMGKQIDGLIEYQTKEQQEIDYQIDRTKVDRCRDKQKIYRLIQHIQHLEHKEEKNIIL